jgi:hypothetical protein
MLHSYDDSICSQRYIQDADEPWDDGPGLSSGPGRYHAQCRMLVTWSYIMILAGSLSVGRLIPEFLLPYDAPYVFKVQPDQTAALTRLFNQLHVADPRLHRPDILLPCPMPPIPCMRRDPGHKPRYRRTPF